MPQLVPDGPDIPDALLEAWDDDRVVFFCGAGVSARAGLPSFNGLVDAAYRRLHLIPPTSKQAWAFPDRLLTNLERVYEPRLIKDGIIEQLSCHNGDVASHKALIELAMFRDQPGFRLVTTNFDHLFERAAAELGVELLPHEAPALPVPADDEQRSFTGLVYLHGRMADGRDDHRRLVLTSADLGNAYLTDGYARRFVLRLVRDFIPVFVGYSLADPTLRYLFDAIDAEEASRRRPRAGRAAYIFRPSQETDTLPGIVEIIPYQACDVAGLPHGLLHHTLGAWSTWRRDPKTRLRTILRNSPDGLPPYELELVKWSVVGQGREPGFGASIFHEMSQAGSISIPPVAWVDILAEAETTRFKAYAAQLESWTRGGRKGDEPSCPQLPLSDLISPAHGHIKLSSGAGPLATWLLRHLDSPEFIQHVVARLAASNGRLHPYFRERIRDALAQGNVSEPAVRVWYALTAEANWAEPAQTKIWRRGATDAGLSMLARTEFLACIEPRLRLGPSSRRELESILTRSMGVEPDATRPWTVHHLADASVVLTCGLMARTTVGQADQFDERDLAQLAWPVTDLLMQALALHAVLEAQHVGADPSGIGQRIEQAPGYANDWQLLRPLLWAAWMALDKSDGRSGRLLIERWRMPGHPTFERFAVAAMGLSRQVTPEELFARLLEEDARLLWDGIPLVDLDRPLQRLWRELGREDQDRLLQAILSAPAEQQEPPRDGRGARLAILAEEGGAELPHSARIYLMAFEAERIRMAESQRAISTADLLALDDEHLLQRLKSEVSSALHRAWAAAVSQEPLRALRLFSRLLADEDVPDRVLLEVMWQATPPAANRDLVTRALEVVSDLPASSFEQRPPVAAALSAVLGRTAEQDWYDSATDGQLLALWDRLIGPVVSAMSPAESDQEPDLSTILPIDELVLFLLHGLDRTRSEKLADRRAAFRQRLDRLIADRATCAAALHQLGRWLPFLHNIEPLWTEKHLLPAFAWHIDAARSRVAWQAYLAGSANMPAALWPKMRLSFVQTFKADRRASLTDGMQDALAHLLVGILLFQPGKPLTDRTARWLLRACERPMLRSAAWYLWRSVEDEDRPERRDELWRSGINHVLRELWPKEIGKQTSDVWDWLLRMAIALDRTFVEATQAIGVLHQPAMIENGGIFGELDKSHHPDSPDRAAAVRWLLSLPIDRWNADNERIQNIEVRLAAHGR